MTKDIYSSVDWDSIIKKSEFHEKEFLKIIKSEPYLIQIYVAGDFDVARNACREFVMSGLCVTLTKTQYVYRGGLEDGVIVGLVNYPRFPADRSQILNKARSLALFLMARLFQSSALINADDTCEWITTREIAQG